MLGLRPTSRSRPQYVGLGGLGFRVQGSGFRVYVGLGGLGFRSVGFKGQGLG